MQTGTILKNNWTAIQNSETKEMGVVLALRRTSPHPFATWVYNNDERTFTGHYFATLTEALEDYDQRVAYWEAR